MISIPKLSSKYGGWLLIGIAALSVFGGVTFWGTGGFNDLLVAQSEQGQLEEQLLDQQRRNDQLRQRIARLQSDDGYVERLARIRLGMVRKDETVFLDSVAKPEPPR